MTLTVRRSTLAIGTAPALQLGRNSILADKPVQSVRVEDLQTHAVFDRPKRSGIRELQRIRRGEKAVEAIRGLTKENELYGFTKGQFSSIDLLKACLAHTGPARLSVSTWTAARNDILQLERLKAAGQLLSVRFLLDFTFARRDPEAAHAIRQTFGIDSIRVALNHSKFALFENDDWRLVLRTSMNLNTNPRFEDFTLANDPELADFIGGILREIWTKQQRSLADAPCSEVRRHFVDEL